MKRTEHLAAAVAPDGTELALYRHDGAYTIRAHGVELMSTRRHCSEEMLGQCGCRGLGDIANARVLIGGLGFGFTLRAALGELRGDARVLVVELIPDVVRWNQNAAYGLGGDALRDPRVEIRVADVGEVLRANRGEFDAVLLDVDNGAEAFTTKANAELYMRRGIEAAVAALRSAGQLAYWLATADVGFEARLRQAGLEVERISVAAYGRGRAAHVVVLGRKG